MYKVFWNDPSNSCGGCFHTNDFKSMLAYVHDLSVDRCDFTVYHYNGNERVKLFRSIYE